MERKYYTLLTRDDVDAPWGVHFGDYKKSLVVLEQQDVIGSGTKRKNTRIICTSVVQTEIDARIKQLNGGIQDEQ